MLITVSGLFCIDWQWISKLNGNPSFTQLITFFAYTVRYISDWSRTVSKSALFWESFSNPRQTTQGKCFLRVTFKSKVSTCVNLIVPIVSIGGTVQLVNSIGKNILIQFVSKFFDSKTISNSAVCQIACGCSLSTQNLKIGSPNFSTIKECINYSPG